MKHFVKDHPLWTAQGILFLLALLLLFFFQSIPSFAEGYSVTVGAAVRLILGAVTCLIPFSLFEITCGAGILYLLFFLGYLLVWGIQKVRKKKTRPILPFLLVIPAVLLLVFDLFVFGFAPSYYRVSTAENMSLPMDEVDEEAVFGALEELCRIVNEAAPSLEKNENGESVAPDLKEVKKRVTAACNSFGDSHSFYQNKGYNAKNFLVSPLMTYTHISGVYGFFTGEANINTNYPHFIVTASLAHESAHARGIGPENECNFLASVVLLESEDEYLAYCGAIYVLDDFLDLCAEIDLERTREAVKDLDPVYKKDMRAYARFFDPYRHSAASEVANTTNNAYLNAMGQEEGTLSYSRILRLISAYFMKNSSR